MRAATTPLERLRRRVMRTDRELATHPLIRPIDRLIHERLLQDRGLLTYSVGDYVWARFGNTWGLQLARIRMAGPVAFERAGAEWWWVDVYWPTRGKWISTHRRVLRSLTPAEVRALREAGVVEALQ